MLDGEVSEIDAVGENTLLAAHCEPNVDAVAAPSAGERQCGLASAAFATFCGENGLTFDRVVRDNDCVVSFLCEADAAVVSPGHRDDVAFDDGVGRIRVVQSACRQDGLVVQQAEVWVAAAENDVIVTFEEDRRRGHNGRFHCNLEYAAEFLCELVEDQEFQSHGGLFFSTRVARIFGASKHTLEVFTILEVADSGAELSREGVH